ncbi:hypothetical protein DFA_12087 [Cavenderia fasciculata]|uniref:Uncharacterized protein n=1 Tax=Cavenderia fasciculata TaxID=261658 RepID=F4QFS0_CACFS|nr:uncharacterized protein DFA_12087 [Cavenderia fasciculata]EGG14317.1 hypothetical protein DFA_12087 [Cavenderia fasciculata]|eukprot:XP_004351026.1 hypothetical protein DFA_12087 [Cavenderia fasciculata]
MYIRNILLLAALLFSVVLGDQVLFNDNGYGTDIYSDSSAAVSNSTNCGQKANKCILGQIVNENDNIGFRMKPNQFDTDNDRFLEFWMLVEGANGTDVYIFIDTVGTPKKVILNNDTYYVSTTDFSGWVFVRVDVTEANVDAETFNGLHIGVASRPSNLTIAAVNLVENRMHIVEQMNSIIIP